jgi:hypothetical protein
MREASELVDELLHQALAEHRYGSLHVQIQDGVPCLVREERVHKIGEKLERDEAA